MSRPNVSSKGRRYEIHDFSIYPHTPADGVFEKSICMLKTFLIISKLLNCFIFLIKAFMIRVKLWKWSWTIGLYQRRERNYHSVTLCSITLQTGSLKILSFLMESFKQVVSLVMPRSKAVTSNSENLYISCRSPSNAQAPPSI